MNFMKYKELTTLSEPELKKLLEEFRGQAHDLAMKLRTNQMKTSHKLVQIKKDIARILTFLSSKK